MTKEEKIQEAYGEYWEGFPEKLKNFALENDGYIETDLMLFENINYPKDENIFDIKQSFTSAYGYKIIRPKSLSGIENNNGWIKIESEFDAPDEDVWVCNFNGNKVAFFHDSCRLFGKKVTHYQPIEKPKPPIY